jgi:4-amino-4-deoxy-L-arabinose transferase-like glycosyltransferase
VVIKMVSGSIYTYAIVVQSTTVTQSKFVPLNATAIILINAITGVIIWEDWKVIGSWAGWVCVFLLLTLGCDLLLSAQLLTNENPDYGAKRRASIIIGSAPIKAIRSMRNLYADIPTVDEGHGAARPRLHTAPGLEHHEGDRRDAWKKILQHEKFQKMLAENT